MEIENNDGAEKRGGSCGCSVLLAAFDDALNENPFLWFELGYTRPTDWMVHVWDRRGGTEKKIITEQDTDRDAACLAAAEKLRALIAANDPSSATATEAVAERKGDDGKS